MSQIYAERNSDGIFVNTETLKEEANHFLKYGYYCPDPWGSPAWKEYWEEQLRRCQDGYSSGGLYITGNHYGYLNFAQIKLTKEFIEAEEKEKQDVSNLSVVEMRKQARLNSKGAAKDVTFPSFWSSDYNYYHVVDIARWGATSEYLIGLGLEVEIMPDHLQGGYHVIVGKSRRKGYSYKNGWVAANNYNCIENSVTIIGAFDKKYLYPEGTMQMANNYVNFFNEHTGWAKARDFVNKVSHKRASYEEKDENNISVEKGYKSTIMALSFGDNPDAAIGKDGTLVEFEEAGKFPNLKESYMKTKPAMEDGIYTTGQMFIFGTGGDMQNGTTDFAEMFYNPLPFKLLPFKNVWDKNVSLNSKCGFFVPDYWNKPGFIDSDGNSDNKGAKEYEEEKRKKLIAETSGAEAYNEYTQQYPFCFHKDTIVSHNDFGAIKLIDYPDVINSGNTELFEIITEGNRKLKCTINHPIWDLKTNTYKHLKDFNIGDELELQSFIFNTTNKKVTIKTELDIFNTEIVITSEWAYFIGIFMGDGSYYKDTVEIVFDYKQKDVGKRICEFMDKNLGGYHIKKYENHFVIIKRNKLFKYIFKGLDLIRQSQKGQSSYKRKVHVPDYIKYGTKEIVKSFIQGIVDSDGYVSGFNPVRINITSKHFNFLSDIQLLLSGFGIYENIKRQDKTTNGYKYESYTIDLYSFNFLLFQKNIGLDSERKGNELKRYRSKRLGAVKKKYPIDKIKSITSIGFHNVYDLTTSDHAINANGIHVHNSPEEAFLQVTGNEFPVEELRNRLATVIEQQLHIKKTQAVTLYRDADTGKAAMKPDLKAKLSPIIHYPMKQKDKTGAVVILEPPVENPPLGLYKAGYDPYRQDQSEGVSLGAFYIYKSSNVFSYTRNILVAWYIGRPQTSDMYNRNVELLGELYNLEVMHENEVTEVVSYFRKRKKLHLLASQPDAVISKNIKNSTVSRVYGIHMNEKLKDAGEKYIKMWLLTERDTDENGIKILNLDTITDIGLLEELIKYNRKGNFDRVMGFMMIMFQLEEEEEGKTYGKNDKTQIAQQILELELFNR